MTVVQFYNSLVRIIVAYFTILLLTWLVLLLGMVEFVVAASQDAAVIEKGMQPFPKGFHGSAPLPTHPSEGVSTSDAEERESTFVLTGLTITGASLVEETDLLAGWPHKLGETISVNDILALTTMISATYRTKGYALSFALIPEQSITDGTFTIQVIEGHIDSVTMEGDMPESTMAAIHAMAAHVLDENVATTHTLERYALLLEDLPGVSVTAVLSPSDKEAGARLLLNTEYDSYSFTLGYNNFLPEILDRHLLSYQARTNGWFTGTDQLQLTINTSPNVELYRNFSLLFRTNVGEDGVNAGFALNQTWLEIQAGPFQNLDIRNTSGSIQLFASYPLLRRSTQNLHVGTAVEFFSSTSTILGVLQFQDTLRKISGWVQADWTRNKWQTVVRGTLEHGERQSDAVASSRTDAAPNYILGNLFVGYTAIVGAWWNGLVSLDATVMGQGILEDDSVVSSVECTYGGVRFGRAFDVGSLAGDRCVMGRLELGWTRTLQLPVLQLPVLNFPRMTTTLYTYLDGGHLWQNGRVFAGENRTDWAASTGGGLQLRFTKGLFLKMEGGKQLSRSDGVNLERVRFLTELSYLF